MMSVANPLSPKGVGRKRPDSSASNTSFSYTTGQPAPSSGKSATPRTRPDIQALMAGMDNKLAAGKAATERADKATTERADKEEVSRPREEASRLKERDVKQDKSKVERLERGSRPAPDAGAPAANGRDIHKLATSLSAKIEGAMGSAKMTRQQLLEELEATKVQAKAGAEARDKLKSELDATRVQAKAIAEAKETLGRELQAARLQGKDISQARDVLGKELDAVRKEVEVLLNKKVALETENATLGAGKRSLEEEKKGLESTKRGLEKDKETLKTEKVALEKDLANTKANANTALSEAKARAEALKEAKDKLTWDLQTARDEIASEKKRTKEQAEEINNLEAEKADLQDALEESQQTLDVVYDLLERSNAYLDKMNG